MTEEIKESEPGADDNQQYLLQLFITGASPNSMRAVTNLKDICETHLKGRYVLEVIDVYQQGSLAIEEQVIAMPMLVKKAPLPQRKLIGDMTDTQKVLKGLGLL